MFAGQVHRDTHQDGVAYYAPADDFAQNDDNASAATGRMTEDEYADSATHSHGSHGMVPEPEQTYETHNHPAAHVQESCGDDHSEPSSEGTR